MDLSENPLRIGWLEAKVGGCTLFALLCSDGRDDLQFAGCRDWRVGAGAGAAIWVCL